MKGGSGVDWFARLAPFSPLSLFSLPRDEDLAFARARAAGLAPDCRRADEVGFVCRLVSALAAIVAILCLNAALPSDFAGFDVVAGGAPAPRFECHTRFLPPLPAAISSIERPVVAESGFSFRMSG